MERLLDGEGERNLSGRVRQGACKGLWQVIRIDYQRFEATVSAGALIMARPDRCYRPLLFSPYCFK